MAVRALSFLIEGERLFAEASIIIERLHQIAPGAGLIPADPSLALEAPRGPGLGA